MSGLLICTPNISLLNSSLSGMRRCWEISSETKFFSPLALKVLPVSWWNCNGSWVMGGGFEERRLSYRDANCICISGWEARAFVRRHTCISIIRTDRIATDFRLVAISSEAGPRTLPRDPNKKQSHAPVADVPNKSNYLKPCSAKKRDPRYFCPIPFQHCPRSLATFREGNIYTRTFFLVCCNLIHDSWCFLMETWLFTEILQA